MFFSGSKTKAKLKKAKILSELANGDDSVLHKRKIVSLESLSIKEYAFKNSHLKATTFDG
jgi:hypothetical protein